MQIHNKKNINKYIYYIYNLIIIIIFFKLECMFTKETTVNSVMKTILEIKYEGRGHLFYVWKKKREKWM